MTALLETLEGGTGARILENIGRYAGPGRRRRAKSLAMDGRSLDIFLEPVVPVVLVVPIASAPC
jgi:hypothetical protein